MKLFIVIFATLLAIQVQAKSYSCKAGDGFITAATLEVIWMGPAVVVKNPVKNTFASFYPDRYALFKYEKMIVFPFSEPERTQDVFFFRGQGHRVRKLVFIERTHFLEMRVTYVNPDNGNWIRSFVCREK